MRKPFTIENQRPRRTINVYGQVLAPKGHGQNAQVDLTKEELLGPGCLKFLTSGRAKLVRGEAPAALVAALSPDEEAPVAVPEPELVIESEPVVEMKPVVEPEPVVEEELPPEPEPVVEATFIPDLEDTSYVWSEEELIALVAEEQKTVCRSRELKVGGREADRVERILQAQQED